MSSSCHWKILVDIHNEDEVISFINNLKKKLKTSHVIYARAVIDNSDELFRKYSLIRPFLQDSVEDIYFEGDTNIELINDILKDYDSVIRQCSDKDELPVSFDLGGPMNCSLTERPLICNIYLHHYRQAHWFGMEVRPQYQELWSDSGFMKRYLFLYKKKLSRLNLPIRPIIKQTSDKPPYKFMEMEIVNDAISQDRLRTWSNGKGGFKFEVGFDNQRTPFEFFKNAYSEYLTSTKGFRFSPPPPRMMKWIYPRLNGESKWENFWLCGSWIGDDAIIKEYLAINNKSNLTPQNDKMEKYHNTYHNLELTWLLGDIQGFKMDGVEPLDDVFTLELSKTKYNSRIEYELDLQTELSDIGWNEELLSNISKKLNIKLGERKTVS